MELARSERGCEYGRQWGPPLLGGGAPPLEPAGVNLRSWGGAAAACWHGMLLS